MYFSYVDSMWSAKGKLWKEDNSQSIRYYSIICAKIIFMREIKDIFKAIGIGLEY